MRWLAGWLAGRVREARSQREKGIVAERGAVRLAALLGSTVLGTRSKLLVLLWC